MRAAAGTAGAPAGDRAPPGAAERGAARRAARDDGAATVKSARRVLEVFEFFAERREPAAVGEIAAALGYPQSSASVLLHSLVRLRYLDHDPRTRQFMPTVRVTLLGDWLDDELAADVGMHRAMEDLARRTGETVILGLQNGVHVQYVQIRQSRHPVRFHLKPGSLRPICQAAVGRVLLAAKSEAEAARLIRRINAERRGGQRVDPAAMMAELARIRREGHAYTEGTLTAGAGVVAVALPPLPHQPPMAIGVGGPTERLRPRRAEFAALLREAAAKAGRPGAVRHSRRRGPDEGEGRAAR